MSLRMMSGALLVSVVCGWGAGAAAPGAESAGRRDTHENLHAVLWMQTSAEYKAITRGLYRLAAEQLDRALEDPRWTAIPEQAGRPDLPTLAPAVILDVDETVLDNSPEEGQRVIDRARYVPDLFARWVTRAEAAAIPGADDFIRYAQRRGVQVYLVTNRMASLKASTVENLAKLQVSLGPDFVLCRGERGWEGDKSSRRQLVAADHRVLLMVGDDLGDFVSISDTVPAGSTEPRMLNAAERAALIDRFSGYWEDRWIVLPNPAYGSWERILYSLNAPDEEQLAKQFEAVRGLSSAH
jgi:5'-nucleotidase (lipoprotein e(P4) family)